MTSGNMDNSEHNNKPEGENKNETRELIVRKSMEVYDKAKEKFEPVSNKLAIILDDLSYKAAPPTADPSTLTPFDFAAKPIQLGMWLIIIFFGFFGMWSAFAPISSAAVARGQVAVESSRKTIQHLEGGIIKEILVKDGDRVEADQPLIVLSDANARAKYELINGQYIAAIALEARLIAERDGLEEVAFPQELLDKKDEKDVQTIIKTQENMFKTRKNSVEGQIDVLNKKIDQLNDQIGGVKAQQDANKRQLELVDEEEQVVKKLLESGNANKPRLLALQRRQAELHGITGQNESDIAKANQAINENQLQMINVRNEFLNNVAKDLREAQVQVGSLKEQLSAAKDVLDRTTIRASQSGIVTGLKFHTVGGVISPGNPIMDIVPQNDEMVVEAQLQPQDIDVVRPGLPARLRLTPYKQRRMPSLDGEVMTVSADAFTDQKTGMSYYTAKIKFDKDMLKKVKNVELYPGMPVDVLIVTGERSLLSYLTTPVRDSMFSAFREE